MGDRGLSCSCLALKHLALAGRMLTSAGRLELLDEKKSDDDDVTVDRAPPFGGRGRGRGHGRGQSTGPMTGSVRDGGHGPCGGRRDGRGRGRGRVDGRGRGRRDGQVPVGA